MYDFTFGVYTLLFIFTGIKFIVSGKETVETITTETVNFQLSIKRFTKNLRTSENSVFFNKFRNGFIVGVEFAYRPFSC